MTSHFDRLVKWVVIWSKLDTWSVSKFASRFPLVWKLTSFFQVSMRMNKSLVAWSPRDDMGSPLTLWYIQYHLASYKRSHYAWRRDWSDPCFLWPLTLVWSFLSNIHIHISSTSDVLAIPVLLCVLDSSSSQPTSLFTTHCPWFLAHIISKVFALLCECLAFRISELMHWRRCALTRLSYHIFLTWRCGMSSQTIQI